MFTWSKSSKVFLYFSVLLLEHGKATLNGDKDNRKIGENHDLVKRGADERNFGGEEAKPHEFPSLVWIEKDGCFHCEGSILDCHWIVTSAYPMAFSIAHFPLDNFSVIAGDHRLDVVEGSEQRVKVVDSILHQRYNEIFFGNIALLRVEPALKFTHKVRPTNLPARCKKHPAVDAKGLWSAGWGTWLPQYHNHSNVLPKSPVKLITKEECEKSDGARHLSSSNFCSLGSGPCWRETGAPLWQIDEATGESVQIGLVAVMELPPGFSFECNETAVFYTDLSFYVGWIHRRISGCGNYPSHPHLRPDIPPFTRTFATRGTSTPVPFKRR